MIQGVDQVIGFAQPEWQAHHQLIAEALEDFIDQRFGFVKALRHFTHPVRPSSPEQSSLRLA